MNEAEASSYFGLPAKHFKVACPVRPVNLGGKGLRYDRRDLDQWIDAEKTGDADLTHGGIPGKL